MRTIAALCLALALPACDRDGESGPPVDSDEPAGEVLEAKGEVTATRSAAGSEPRDLGAGDAVYADDTVATGAGASVRIRLHHNGAAWELNEEARRKIRASAAWSAEPSDDPGLLASRDEPGSVGAGRHAENQSAGTRSTAVPAEAAAEKKAEAAAGAERELERAKPARPDVGSLGELGGSGEAGGGGEDLGVGGLGAIGSGPGGEEARGDGSGGPRSNRGQSRAQKAPKIRAGAPRVRGALDREVIRRVIRRHHKRLQACYRSALKANPKLAGRVTVKFTVKADGSVGTVRARGVSAKVSACVTAAFESFRFPQPEGGGTVRVSYPIHFKSK